MSVSSYTAQQGIINFYDFTYLLSDMADSGVTRFPFETEQCSKMCKNHT